MAWRNSARGYSAAAVLGVMSVSALARPASAQEIERVLAGVRLGSKSTTVLAKFGNPNEVVIGDVVSRAAPGGAPGQPGAPGGGAGDEGGLPGVQGAPGFLGGGGSSGPRGGPRGFSGSSGPPSGFGGSGGDPRSGPPAGSGGPPAGYRGGGSPPGGFSGGGGGSSSSPFGAPGGAAGFPGEEGVPGGGGGGAAGGGGGAFGNTVSSAARQQEVTWIYNRKINNNLVSYSFLIGPNGDVSQINVTGYAGSGVRTKRGVGLGATYKDVVRIYGYPEEHAQSGRVLITSYRKNAHVQFQFLTTPGQTTLQAGGNKVIAITIATVE